MEADDHLADVGRKTVLGPSMVHGPRWCYQNYLDAMSMVKWCGMPTYFVTMCVHVRVGR